MQARTHRRERLDGDDVLQGDLRGRLGAAFVASGRQGVDPQRDRWQGGRQRLLVEAHLLRFQLGRRRRRRWGRQQGGQTHPVQAVGLERVGLGPGGEHRVGVGRGLVGDELEPSLQRAPRRGPVVDRRLKRRPAVLLHHHPRERELGGRKVVRRPGRRRRGGVDADDAGGHENPGRLHAGGHRRDGSDRWDGGGSRRVARGTVGAAGQRTHDLVVWDAQRGPSAAARGGRVARPGAGRLAVAPRRHRGHDPLGGGVAAQRAGDGIEPLGSGSFATLFAHAVSTRMSAWP